MWNAKLSLRNLLVNFIILSLSQHVYRALDVKFPSKFRSDGRLTFLRNGKIVGDHLAFSEAVDAYQRRSVISIGYISYKPTRYFIQDESLKIEPGKTCKPVMSDTFIPEIADFVNQIFTRPSEVFNKPQLSGPSNFITEVKNLLTDSKLKKGSDNITTYRNVPCNVYYNEFELSIHKVKITMETIMPQSGVHFPCARDSYFSFKVVFTKTDQTDQVYTAVIDYYNIEDAGLDDLVSSRINNDFNMDLYQGCGMFLPKSAPSVKIQSFSMMYFQRLTGINNMIAYDHVSGFLRKEIPGKSVNIWDLNEDLLYHLRSSEYTSVIASSWMDLNNIAICSIVKVTDSNLGSAYRPYETEGKSLNVLKMMGAEEVAYLGKQQVRNLPCLVYEAVLTYVPVIFGLTRRQASKKGKQDFIVTFHILDSDRQSFDGFRPAKITLHRRDVDNNHIELVDELDVFDFYWSLEGWDLKESELFLAPECFNDDDEQMRLDLSVNFGDRHHQMSADKSLLPYNKFKLERTLIDEIFTRLGVSKAHLIEFKLNLRSDHVNLDMVIGDHHAGRELIYLGEGSISKKSAGYTIREGKHLTHHECMSIGALSPDTRMFMYCQSEKIEESTCSVISGESPPIEKGVNPTGLDCRVYEFRQLTATKNVDKIEVNELKLAAGPVKFLALRADGKNELLTGKIRNIDVSRSTVLEAIKHYSYLRNSADSDNQKGDPLLSSFDSINYFSEADCMRMCDRDVTCRSYSYCSDQEDNKCILSTLDIRASQVKNQLIHNSTPVTEDKSLKVKGANGREYSIEFKSKCNIMESNHMNKFTHTEENFQINSVVASQFQTAKSAFDCAAIALSTGNDNMDNIVNMFAYCPTAHTCIMDESLFKPTIEPANEINNGDDDEDEEVACRMYKKKYLMNFKVSTEVVKQTDSDSDDDGPKQLKLALGSAEQCAKYCMQQMETVCLSFDFCLPDLCYINQVGHEHSESASSSSVGLERRSNCLHYHPDQKLKKIQHKRALELETHNNGKGSSINPEEQLNSSRLSMWAYSVILCSFIGGIVLGKFANERLERVKIHQLHNRSSIHSSIISSANELDESYDATANDVYNSDTIQLQEIDKAGRFH